MAHKHKEDAKEAEVLESCEKVQLDPEENVEHQDCSYPSMEK